MWSIPHFLYGVLCAFIPYFDGVTALDAFLIMIVSALLWEVYEKLKDIRETVWNNIMDMLLPILAFFITLKVLELYPLEREEQIVIFTAVLIVWAYCNISGWRAYRRRVKAFMS